MIDNFNIIQNLLEFRSKDDFYFLQILQRKKDFKKEGKKINGTNNNSRLIKAYYISSIEYFDFIKPEVIELCNIFQARAGINLNRRSYHRMALQHLKKVTDQILNKDFHKAHKAYSSVVGAYNDDSDKKWIIDIDDTDMGIVDDTIDLITNIQPYGNKEIAIIPSKSGYHLITSPFNLQDFLMQPETKDIEVHKNNPTNLYIP